MINTWKEKRNMSLQIWTIPSGVSKIKNANDKLKIAQNRHKKNIEKLEKEDGKTRESMQAIENLKEEIRVSFEEFSDVFEKIKNRPIFREYSKNGVRLPKYDGGKFKKVFNGTKLFFAGFSAATVNTATSMIGSSESILALGGLSMATGAATFGIGLLAGGVMLNLQGKELENKADEVWNQMLEEETKIRNICIYLVDLRGNVKKYYNMISKVNDIYEKHLSKMKNMVFRGHADWKKFSTEEQKIVENTVHLVSLLYQMCKVELLLKDIDENNFNKINKLEVDQEINIANIFLEDQKM